MKEDADELTYHEFFERERRLRRIEEEEFLFPKIGPLEEYDDTIRCKEDGADASDPRKTPGLRLASWLIAGRCCGWLDKPTAIEVVLAMRNRNPDRQLSHAAGVILNEATEREAEMALDYGLCSERDMARWLRWEGERDENKVRALNRRVKRRKIERAETGR